MDRRKTRIRKDVRVGDCVIRRKGWHIPSRYATDGDIMGIYDGEKLCVCWFGIMRGKVENNT